MTFIATRVEVSNRGKPPESFLEQLVTWGRTAPEEIFAVRMPPVGMRDPDIYAAVRADLGPWTSLLHRRSAMLEVMRVLAGYESSWNWEEGVDLGRHHDVGNPVTEETGAWQVSYDSLVFGEDLRRLASNVLSPVNPDTFIREMKHNHPFAMEYIARLLRHTTRHNGPVARREINWWLNRGAVEEFQRLLVSDVADT